MSNTLVIHPEDKSTVMLKHVYEGKGYDVINDPNISKDELIKEIKCHDRIIMLGHGCGYGLLNPEYMRIHLTGGYLSHPIRPLLIDDSFGDLLRTKNTISMWCYSDDYFRRNRIKGFHTGMIISEVREADLMLGYSPLSEEELFANMVLLARLLGECIDMPPLEMKNYILSHYNSNDEITKFNRENIIVL